MLPSSQTTGPILDALLESTDDMIWAVDRERFGLLVFNSSLSRYLFETFGSTAHIGDMPEDVLPPELARRWRGLYSRALEQGPFSAEYALSGGKRYLLLSVNLLRADGDSVGVSIFGKDVTAIKVAQQALQESQQRFLDIAASIPGVIYQFVVRREQPTAATYISGRAEPLLGISPEREGFFERFTERVADEDRERFLASVRQAITHVRPWDFEGRFVKPSGEVLWLRGSSIPQRKGEEILFNGVLLDITQRKVAEIALRDSEARYRTLLESAPEAIVVYDVATRRLVDANDNASHLLGLSRDSLLSLELGQAAAEEAIAPSIPGLWEESHLAEALRGETPVFERALPTADGKLCSYEVRLVRLPALGRDLVRGSFVDITDRKRLEQSAAEVRARLEHAQRLEALGTLAGGIAHDFNNILGAIIGFTDLALTDLGEDSPVRSLLENVERGANRATDLVRQILAFSRRLPQEKKPVQPVAIVKEVLKLIRATLPSTISVHEQYEATGPVLADPGKIHQIVMNLCTNAGLAMRERGGTLEVRVCERDIDAAMFPQHPRLATGRYVCLSVKDTGCGIAPHHMARLFEPFFTTRLPGEGTGLGLSVVHGIVESCGGAINVTSDVGLGTTFEILLPGCDETAHAEPPAPTPVPGRGRLLFIDDETALLEVARQGLSRFGYELSTFGDPSLALAAFRAHPGDFDLVVTDLTMPGLTGDVLATEIRRIRPCVPIVLMSGYPERLTPEEAKAAGFDGVMVKPLRMSALARLIGDLSVRSKP